MNKDLYKGIFNWYGQTITLYRHAKSESMAKMYFSFKIAELANTSWHRVYSYFFTDKKDNYTITNEGTTKTPNC